MATYGLLHPKYVFGLNSQCNGANAYFLDASTLIYPAGNTIVMYNMDTKNQSFLHGVEKGKGITSFAISNTKVYGAVGQLGEKPSIVIFDLKTNKRRKTLQYNETLGAKEYISLAFTTDSINLASLTGPPEYNVIFWKWDKARMLSITKTTGGVGPVYELSTNPIENNVICAIGKNTFRFFRYNDGHMKPFGFQRGDTYHFLCHTWLGKGDRLIAGTSDGKLMLFERGEFKYEIPIIRNTGAGGGGDKTVVFESKDVGKSKGLKDDAGAPNKKDGLLESIQGSVASIQKGNQVYEWKEITAVVALSKGFALAKGEGHIIVYEEQSSYESLEEHYKPLHYISIPTESSEPEDRLVKSLSINSTEEILIATTRNGQLFYFSLATVEIKEPHEMVFEHATNCSFHYGPIVALDIAIHKSLFCTAGTDNFIRIWNYVTYSQEGAKEFPEAVHCLSFHPTGLFILAGCADKIRLFTVLMDDIRELRDFHIRGCHECRFSTGGHLFAVANGNIVQIYNTSFYDNISNLKGHNNKIKKLKWSQDDNKLYSCGSDGAIYEWDVASGRRTADYVERGSNLVDIAFTPDNKTHFAISGFKFIKEIQIQEGIMLKELALGLVPFSITMSKSGRILIGGLEDGILRSFRQPLTYSNEWFDFHMHVDAVNAICITYDETTCITVSADGSIIIWKVTDSEGRVTKQEKEVYYSNEILVTKADLEERDMAMKELKQKFGELRLDMEYQIKRKEMNFLEEIKNLKSGFHETVHELNTNIDALVKAKEEHDIDYHNFVSNMTTESKLSMSKLESHYNAKLIAEYEKYNTLQNLLEDTIQDYESKLVNLDTDRGSAIDELVEYFEGKIKDKNSALEHAFNEARNQMTESEEMKKQIEEDADLEILQLTTAYEKKLGGERDINAKLKGEAGIMKKKFATMQKEIEEQKNEVQRLLQEGEKMKTIITLTEKEVSTLRKDLIDRDVNVHDKEKIIFDLKKTNNELEKFKFVLDYKIKELKKMIEPKEREIVYLKQQNSDMERELEGIIMIRNGLILQVNELTNKLRVTESEYQVEKRLRWKLSILIERIRTNMCRAVGLVQDYPALKAIVKSMYDKYGHSLQVGRASNVEQEAICELVRQKNHLEMCLTSVKKKMSKDVEFTRTEQLKIMHENMLLVYEINNLRRELKLARDRILSYEVALGVTASSQASEQAAMRLKLQNAIVERDELEIDHNKELEAKENLIEAQQGQIENLAVKIMKVQDFINDVRPETVPTESANYVREILTKADLR